MAFITLRKALLPLRRLSRGFVSNFVPEIFLYFWRKLQNTKCSGFSIDISLNSDIIESHQLNASQDCFAGASCERGTRLNCTQIERRRNTMKIIKRNGSEVPFDITKIITAVTKASDSVSRKSSLTQEQILSIANDVTEQCQALNRAVSVEEIQDMVENLSLIHI